MRVMKMDSIILWSYLLIILILNYTAVKLHKSGKLKLYYFGLAILILAPIIAFLGGVSLHYFSNAAEEAPYGGFFLGFVTFVNGIVVIIGSIILSLRKFFQNRHQKDL
jgi:hypothetical protein